MDYLDPQKQFRHSIILMVGYVFVAIAIIIATMVLLYQAYGFGLSKNGTVIQNGLIFFSSQPSGAKVTLSNTKKQVNTNARLVQPAGIYKVVMTLDGYRNWQRTIEVDGGSVMHYDYPFLFPIKLNTSNLQTYGGVPGLSSQSIDLRWLMVQQPGLQYSFAVTDLKNPSKAAQVITLPATIVSKASTSESWQPVEWADYNTHVLLVHLYDGKSEYILVDRSNVNQSINLNTTLAVNPTRLNLNDKKYDRYDLETSPNILQSATLSNTTPVTLLDHVIDYKSYATDEFLYITDSDAPANKVLLKLQIGTQSYTLHVFQAGSKYVLDLAKYSGKLYVAAGSSVENKVYIFKDPVGQLKLQPKHVVVPVQVLHVNSPDYLSFSKSAQYIVAEHLTQFGVFDIENKTGYNYSMSQPLDAPQSHIVWMDGSHLQYVSNGKLLVFDFDSTNQQSLVSVNPAFTGYFAPDFKHLYSLVNSAQPNQINLTQTSLIVGQP